MDVFKTQLALIFGNMTAVINSFVATFGKITEFEKRHFIYI